MIRQRITLRTPVLAYLVRLLTIVLALILIWYGAMLVLLAAKVAPHTVNSLSAYLTIYRSAARLTVSDFTDTVRLIAGLGGVVVFVVLVYLALQELPRAHLARGDVYLSRDRGGEVTVTPRAIERIAEIAARTQREVQDVSARFGDRSIAVQMSVQRAASAPRVLRETRERIVEDLARHELPALAVDVTLTGFHPTTRRQLS